MSSHPRNPNNWGRWGADDQKGSLNQLSGDVVLAALAAPKQGRVLSLSLPIKGSTSSAAAESVPHLKGRPLPQHFMSVDGADYCAGAKPPRGLSIADDMLMISPHGTSTHMDALCHMWQGDELYNGHASSRVRSYGAGRCGMEHVDGIVTRGVLIDVARHRGVPVMDPADRISVQDLEAISAAAGITIGKGDAVVLRTGWPTVYAKSPETYWKAEPGLSGEAGRWLAERDVTVVASDNSAISALTVEGGAAEGIENDLHLLLLWRHGIYLMEMLWLEELSAANVSSFLFVVAPLKIVGGTGSPVNPLAVL